MANDRIYIKCKQCGDTKLLFKYFAGAGFTFWPIEDDEPEHPLEKWTDEHFHTRIGSESLNGDPGFELVTESDKPREELSNA